VPAAEAKKAEGASEETRLIPKPPARTGRLAWSHCCSVKDTLQILHKADFKIVSKFIKRS
jgi:hypothetical protein